MSKLVVKKNDWCNKTVPVTVRLITFILGRINEYVCKFRNHFKAEQHL